MLSRLSVCSLALTLTVMGCADPVQNDADPPTPTAKTGPAINYGVEGKNGPDAEEEFKSTDSGLKYRILRKGDGEQPTADDSVVVSYRGWLDDGSEFDSSYKRNEPLSFPLRGVVRGWTEGMQLVGEGGKIELEIPSELGYGAAGRPGIPPNATLHFIVELHEIQ